MMKRTLIALVAALAAGPVTAEDNQRPYEGDWSISAAHCLFSEDEWRMQIRGGELFGYEHACKMGRPRQTSAGLVFNMNCEGEGEKYKETMTIRMEGLDRMNTGKGKSYVRCLAMPQPEKIKKLIEIWHSANSTCRGTSGPASEKACEERESLTYGLDGYKWCYGKKNEAGYQMKWHKCTANSNRASS